MDTPSSEKITSGEVVYLLLWIIFLLWFASDAKAAAESGNIAKTIYHSTYLLALLVYKSSDKKS